MLMPQKVPLLTHTLVCTWCKESTPQNLQPRGFVCATTPISNQSSKPLKAQAFGHLTPSLNMMIESSTYSYSKKLSSSVHHLWYLVSRTLFAKGLA
jgi:hypothetical protein